MTAVFFAFHIHYVAIHLATEHHLADASHEEHATSDEPAGVLDFHDGDADAHLPHFASQHVLRLLSQVPFGFLLLDFEAVDTRVGFAPPALHFELFLTERQNPPGEATAGPFQPRAPPIG